MKVDSMGTDSKRCRECRKLLPVDNFCKQKGSADGLRHICRKCMHKQYKAWYEAHKGEVAKKRKEYVSNHREEYNAYKRGYYKTHTEQVKQCVKKSSKVNSERKKEYQKKYMRDYQQTEHGKAVFRTLVNKRRALRKAATIEEIPYEYVEKLRNGTVCPYCSKPIVKVELDHIIPLSKGGKHSVDNLISCCFTCNRQKRNMPLADWLKGRNHDKRLDGTVESVLRYRLEVYGF
jgi:5-methylcytosine-specific restriction endonuclease McrA